MNPYLEKHVKKHLVEDSQGNLQEVESREFLALTAEGQQKRQQICEALAMPEMCCRGTVYAMHAALVFVVFAAMAYLLDGKEYPAAIWSSLVCIGSAIMLRKRYMPRIKMKMRLRLLESCLHDPQFFEALQEVEEKFSDRITREIQLLKSPQEFEVAV